MRAPEQQLESFSSICTSTFKLMLRGEKRCFEEMSDSEIFEEEYFFTLERHCYKGICLDNGEKVILDHLHVSDE